MLTDFRKQKYYHLFATFWDFDKTGAINKHDVAALTDKARTYKQWEAGELELVEDTWFQVFRSMLKEIGKNEEELTLEEWFYLMQKYAEDPRKTEWVELYEEFVFQYCQDKDKGGITAEKQVAIWKYFGIPEEDAKLAFTKASSSKPVINRSQYKILWKQYFTSDDRDLPGNYIHGRVKYV